LGCQCVPSDDRDRKQFAISQSGEKEKVMKRHVRHTIGTVLFVFAAGIPLYGTSITVTTMSDDKIMGDGCSLREALEASDSG
jgi:CSLREA domain-containing protein